jgi:hypothetical protein
MRLKEDSKALLPLPLFGNSPVANRVREAHRFLSEEQGLANVARDR